MKAHQNASASVGVRRVQPALMGIGGQRAIFGNSNRCQITSANIRPISANIGNQPARHSLAMQADLPDGLTWLTARHPHASQIGVPKSLTVRCQDA
jgi:hypothetical protein